jgi:hypothetical protein
MTPYKLLILLTIFSFFACVGAAYILSMPTKVPKNAGLRALKTSFAQSCPQNLWLHLQSFPVD